MAGRSSKRSVKRGAPQRGVPVVARRTPEERRSQQASSRQRYDSLAGITVPLRRGAKAARSARRWRISLKAAVRFLLLFLLADLVLLLSLPQLRVQQVEVQGVQHLKAADVQAVLDVVHKPAWWINPQRVADEILAAYPAVQSVQVQRTIYPAALQVTVIERQPVFVIEQNGKSYWMDASGVLFPARGEAENLVQVQALSPLLTDDMTVLPSDLLTALQTVATTLPAGSVLVYDGQHGLGWEEQDGLRVFLGRDLSNLDIKLRLYQGIMAALRQRSMSPVMVDISHVNAPYYRLGY